MAIESVNELPGASHRLNEKGESEYTRKFQVITSGVTIGALAVETATGIPRIGDIYVGASGEFDTTSICKSIEPSQDSDAPRRWGVTCQYGPPSVEEEARNPNPLLRPAVLRWGFAPYTRACWRDVDGLPILNSAREFFDPPPEIDDSRPTLTVQRNEVSYSPSLAIQYQDATNSDTFLGCDPGQVKIAGISAESQSENGYFFFVVSYEFHFRREGWTLRPLDQGRNRLVGGKITPINQRDEVGAEVKRTPVVDPVPLDGNGAELVSPTPSTVVFLSYDVYKSMPFAALGI